MQLIIIIVVWVHLTVKSMSYSEVNWLGKKEGNYQILKVVHKKCMQLLCHHHCMAILKEQGHQQLEMDPLPWEGL